MPNSHHPHDENFKHNFSRLDVARDFLKYNLPKKVLARIDLSTLQAEPNEFLPSKYREKRKADLLFSVQDKNGEKMYAFLHLEAQIKHEGDMAIRVWEYHVAIAREHVRRYKARKIPLILTFVLYNGKQEWTSAKSIAELFENFDLYVDVSLRSPFLLSLKEKDINQLKKQGLSAAPQLIMQAKAKGEFCSVLGQLIPLLKKHNQLDDENVNYMASNDGHGEGKFLENFSKFDQETANYYKNMFEAGIQREAAKRVRKEVRKVKIENLKEVRKAEKRSLQLGKVEGKVERNREIAIQMLSKGESIDKIILYTGLSLKEIEKLKA